MLYTYNWSYYAWMLDEKERYVCMVGMVISPFNALGSLKKKTE